jgi:Reverse transcriptase (RNA-dependent DNA polymerase)
VRRRCLPRRRPALAPLQLGVGVPGGTQVPAASLATGHAADPDCVTCGLDFRNAFNSVSCAAVLAAVAQRQPSLARYAEWLYEQPMRLFLLGAPAGTAPVASACGVRQGNPCSPLLFGSTLQQLLKDAQARHPDVRFIAIHDNGYIQDDPVALVPVVHDFLGGAAAIGLAAVFGKSYSRSPRENSRSPHVLRRASLPPSASSTARTASSQAARQLAPSSLSRPTSPPSRTACVGSSTTSRRCRCARRTVSPCCGPPSRSAWRTWRARCRTRSTL